ncbi:MAG TPA: alpha/beta fold hydrolase [Xanthobacteraceae bacterium]|nr:alpha/beta fold hydrolase [Xanthobacteraceae bacterium]
MVWVVRIFSAFRWLLAAIGVIAIVLAALLAVPVTRPPELPSIRAGAVAIDQAGLPNLSYFQARDGTTLAYRLYPAADGNTQNIAIVIHGSAGHSTGMNEIARRLAADNFMAVAPDMRGHGASGTRGDIGYVGQLDNDLQDLLAELRREHHDAHFSLLGFSAGGGFALRVSAGKLASDFNRLVLLSPYLGYDAPSSRSSKGKAQWANADMPRIVALVMLRRLHFRCCEALPVIAFALRPGAEKFVTTWYSFRLLANFGPPPNLNAAFRRLKMPTMIIAGADDELMVPDKYSDIVAGIEPAISVKILPGLGHIDMLHAPAAIDAISDAFKVK